MCDTLPISKNGQMRSFNNELEANSYFLLFISINL